MKEDIKQLTIDFFHNTWGSPYKRNEKAHYQLFKDNLIVNSPLGYKKGSHELRGIMQAWFSAFPDAIAMPESVRAYENSVLYRWRAEGTHLGEFRGKEASGKKVIYGGESAFIFNSRGQVVHYVSKLDLSDVMKQLDLREEIIKEAPAKKLHGNMDVLFQTLEAHYLGLTRREIECLALFMSGFTAKQVGTMLSISNRTVEVYLEKARSILACHSKMQMMEKCLFEDTYFVFHALARLLIEAQASKLLMKNP